LAAEFWISTSKAPPILIQTSSSSATTRTSARYGNIIAGSTYLIDSKLRVGFGFEYFSFSDQAVESNIGDIDGINRSYNFFVSMRWRPDFSR
tara:strand:- start:394 stop:669 length:276 start_codon:yes stop_codon:yes gene_type:complete